MAEEKINNTVLIAPLDWGLGHATRCIPIIEILLQKKCRVLIAASGAHKVLLQDVFPQLEFLELKGYGIKYANRNMLFNLAKQLPNFLNTIKDENSWLDKIIDDYKLDLVISDNRYGLYSKKIPCIFITHQLQLEIPRFLSWANNLIQKKIYQLINNFSQVWVPDYADEKHSISGKLGHPKKLPNIPVQYVGPLSRFSKNNSKEINRYALMACISGPEPQRSLFESIILPQLKNINGQVLLVRGKPGSKDVLPPHDNITIVNHLSTTQMQQAFEQSEFILSRSGYSTLMDMETLGCKCIYVPTPGQTEQEYLGKRLSRLKKAIVFKQKAFDLVEALKLAKQFDYRISSPSQTNILDAEITQILKAL